MPARTGRLVEERDLVIRAGLEQRGQAEVRRSGADSDGMKVRQLIRLGHDVCALRPIRIGGVSSQVRQGSASWIAARRLAASTVLAALPVPPVKVNSRSSVAPTGRR